MQWYILAIDQSTSGTKAMLVDAQGAVTARCDHPHRQIVDDRGWVEHDPEEIFSNLLRAVRDVLNNSEIKPEQILGAAISNQRETAIVWDSISGKPVYNAIVWQCARGEDICRRIAEAGGGETVRRVTGIPLSPYYSAAKIAWILENIPAAQENQSRLCCSTMDSWLIFRLCGGEPMTDYSNASRAQLLDLETLRWSEEACALFGINSGMLPSLRDSDSLFGHSDFGGILPKPVPVHAALGDSHGALFGQGCLLPGMVKTTYGTGSSIMMNIGGKPIRSERGLVTSLAWSMSGRTEYVLEGNINYTGAVIKWLVEDMGLITASNESGKLAAQTRHVDGLYLVPAFSGLGAPYWDGAARGILCGLTRGVGRAEIVRAAEECIAYQIADILYLMAEDTGRKIETLRVDGGPTADRFLMQFQADILGCLVRVPAVEELSGAGAAYAAGIAMGFYEQDSLFANPPRAEYAPQMDATTREQYYRGWQNAVQMILAKENAVF
ncbi:MAG: glycerol kinase GlpK [Oscillospiraceae bacterium]|nr:glycerol kinase GlpK [Oscillospiraceae bacterium]